MAITKAQRQAVADEAERIGLENYGYRFAAAGPHYYDCSGLVVAAWMKAKRTLPHNSAQLAQEFGMAVPNPANEAKLLPGDLLFYYGDTPAKVTHVAVFLRRHGGLYVVAQATDEAHGSEIIKARKYANPTGLGFIR